MRSASNLEYFHLCREFQCLVDGRLDKFYDMENGEFRLRVRIIGKHEDLAVKLGERIHLTKYIRDAPKTPSNLAMHLRKRIEGLRIESIRQHDLDRVIEIRFYGEESHTLVFEKLAEGNLLLLGANDKILRCFRRDEWKDRVLKEGSIYKFPQSERLSPPFSLDSLSKIIESKSIIAILASKTNFGNDYLEEACTRAGIAPKISAKEISTEKLCELASELNKILESPRPTIYLKDGIPTDYSLTMLSKYSSLVPKETKCLSEAIDECANAGFQAEKSPHSVEQEKKLEKLKKRLALQEEHVERMLRESDELKKKGDEIYARYQEVEGILKTIIELKKQGKSWDEIKKALEGKCEIDEHSGKVFLPTLH
ncbi:MAG: NFACT family protein [Candidatus Micrarchaeota archaeon]